LKKRSERIRREGKPSRGKGFEEKGGLLGGGSGGVPGERMAKVHKDAGCQERKKLGGSSTKGMKGCRRPGLKVLERKPLEVFGKGGKEAGKSEERERAAIISKDGIVKKSRERKMKKGKLNLGRKKELLGECSCESRRKQQGDID